MYKRPAFISARVLSLIAARGEMLGVHGLSVDVCSGASLLHISLLYHNASPARALKKPAAGERDEAAPRRLIRAPTPATRGATDQLP